MKKVIHYSDERGKAEFGWLHSRHSFSFGHYYDPDKMGFGLLRVLNDDFVEPGQGFGTHPHDNMEIISIPLEGALEHKDSMGTGSVIKKGDVQVMSAGSGVTHSEFNHSKTEPVKFLQIWIIPREQNVAPRYDQKSFPIESLKKGITTVVSGEKAGETLYIHQNAALSLGKLNEGESINYRTKYKGNGIYLFVLDGNIEIDNDVIGKRDATGVYDTDVITINASADTDFVLIEVPMN